MRLLAILLQIFSYLFHFCLSLFLGGIAAVGWLSGTNTFAVDLVPWWTGQTLVKWLLGAGLLGVALTLLAVMGKLRPAFAVWTLAVLCLLVNGLFLTNYSYEGAEHFEQALWALAAAAGAFVGGVSQARRKARGKR